MLDILTQLFDVRKKRKFLNTDLFSDLDLEVNDPAQLAWNFARYCDFIVSDKGIEP